MSASAHPARRAHDEAVRVLLIDADPLAAGMAAQALRGCNFAVEVSITPAQARSDLARSSPDLIVLDAVQRGESGLSLCRFIRHSCRAPILFLSSSTLACDCVVALEMGADDYMTKPFCPRELVARARAVLRRAGQAQPQARSAQKRRRIAAGWFLCTIERRLEHADGRLVQLTQNDYALLQALRDGAGRTLSRTQLVALVEANSSEVSLRSIDNQVCRLRRKLGRIGLDGLVVTAPGEGYRLNAARGTERAKRRSPARS